MHRQRSSPRSALLAGALALVLATGLLPMLEPPPVVAGTAETMEASILTWVNAARAERGLGGLRTVSGLAGVAGSRASTLASIDQLSHEIAGCLRCQLDDRGIAWKLFGEVLASNNWPWGSQSARVVFESWRDSAEHWDILMNPKMDSIGVGVAQHVANGVTYATAVLIDAPGSTVVATPKPAPAATARPAPRATPTPTPAPTPVPPAAPVRVTAFARAGMIAL
jgi:uncharacterized protein YkwD